MDRRAAVLNFWMNQPEIVSVIAPGFELSDWSIFFDNPRNVMLEHPHGIALFFYEGDGAYDGHYVFGPKLRGKKALVVAKGMINVIFTRYNATTILGHVATVNRPARVVTRALGFVPTGHGSVDTFHRPCVDYVLTRSQWERLPWAVKVNHG